MKTSILIAIVCISTFSLAQSPVKKILPDDFGQSFADRDVKGSIIVHDHNNNLTYFYDEARCNTRYSPASTFKIFNSLAGLESGVIPDTSHVIPWDGVKRGNYAAWNRSNSLKSAFKYSVVWYYQELARRVGKERMQKYVSDNHYGNENIGATIDGFWLSDYGGAFRVSQAEQIDMLRKLYADELSFSKKNQQLVKGIMLAESNDAYNLYAKTGMNSDHGSYFGWYVGWFETKGNVYFFATHLEAPDFDTILKGARQGVTFDIMRKLNILE